MSQADPDYECTPEEIREFLEHSIPREPGHGSMDFIPTLEHYALESTGVFWGNRRVHPETGWITYDWLVPPPFECEE